MFLIFIKLRQFESGQTEISFGLGESWSADQSNVVPFHDLYWENQNEDVKNNCCHYCARYSVDKCSCACLGGGTAGYVRGKRKSAEILGNRRCDQGGGGGPQRGPPLRQPVQARVVHRLGHVGAVD